MQNIATLLDAVYAYHSDDYEAVISALKKGTLGRKVHSDQDIAQLRCTKIFRQRYSKYIRKLIRPAETMTQLIDDWFVRYKVTASPGSRPAQGRLDPRTKVPLFTEDTRPAVENCKEKAWYLSDPLPLEQMYHVVPANPNSQHKLPQYNNSNLRLTAIQPARQQPQQQQPDTNTIIAPRAPPTDQSFTPALPMLLPIVLSYRWMQYAPQLPLVSTPPYCCGRYMSWLQQTNRMGRPPHDVGSFKRKQNNK